MDYYIFNPENDEALAKNTNYYQPPASIIRMTHELSKLQSWIIPYNAQLFIPGLKLNKGDHIRPWGWSKYLLNNLRSMGITELPHDEYVEKWRALSHRRNAAYILDELFSIHGCTGEAKEYASADDINTLLSDNSKRFILKSPWSSSGRGVHTYEKDKTYAINNWITHTLHTQGSVIIEPEYNKIYDFAMEFKASPDEGVRFAGYSFFKTSPDYHIYLGNLLESDSGIEKFITRYIPLVTLKTVKERLTKELTILLKGSNYDNYLGVDMMICLENDEYKLHPCVEINLRMNMGMVARILYDRFISPVSGGFFNIEHFSQKINPVTVHEEMMTRYPLSYDKSGRITSGYLSLTDINEDTTFHAMALIMPKKDNLMNYFRKT